MTEVKTFSRDHGNERTIRIDCPICGPGSEKPFWDCGTHSYVRCEKCGLVYQNPRPVEEDLLNRYDDEYFRYEEENEENFFNLMRLGLEDVGFPSLEKRILQPRRFLDVGCATGRLIEWIRDRGWHTWGVEVCAPAARYGIEHRGVDIHIGTLRTAPFSEGSFDFIHSSHLIEHLTDPVEYVATVKRLLRPGGHFVCVTPNVAGFQSRLLRGHWRSAIADHLFLFNLDTLKRLLEDHGFAIKGSGTWGGLATGLAPSWIKRPLDKAAKRHGFGDVMIYLAQKPD